MQKTNKKFYPNRENTYVLNRTARKRGGQIVVFTAPPGAGKTSVINAIIDLNYDLNIIFEQHQLPRLALTYVPGVTTRKQREGERCGYDFQFLTTKLFYKRQQRGDFLLSFSSTNLYAVDGPDIEKRLLDSDTYSVFIYNLNAWQVPKLLRQFLQKPKVIFLNAPSIKELEQRKNKRGGMTAEEIAQRRRMAQKEIKQGKNIADIQIINREFATTVQRCTNYIITNTIFKKNNIPQSKVKQILTDINKLFKKKRTIINEKILTS